MSTQGTLPLAGCSRRGQATSRANRRSAMTEAVGRLGPLPHAEGARWRFDSRWILIGVPVALVVWLAIVPLTFLVWQSFLTPHTAARPAEFTLDNFRTAYSSAETLPAVYQFGRVRVRHRRVRAGWSAPRSPG